MTKKRVNILVEEEILNNWDNFSEKIGISRTAMIHNAMKIYQMFVEGQLNGDREDVIKDQLDQLEELIKGLETKKRILQNEEKEIETHFEKEDLEIQDYEIIAGKILELLGSWGALPESTIAGHLSYPNWIIWTVLKKLKAQKKVIVERGEWALYER